MTPETWLPTCTVVTAERVPVAVTVIVTSPWLTFSVLNCSSCLPRPRQESTAAAMRMIAVERLTIWKPLRSRLRANSALVEAGRSLLQGACYASRPISPRGSPHGFVLQRSASTAAGASKYTRRQRAERDFFRAEHLIRRHDHRQRAGDDRRERARQDRPAEQPADRDESARRGDGPREERHDRRKGHRRRLGRR